MRKHIAGMGMALALGVGHASGAFAQANPANLVKQRQAGMTLIGKYFGPLSGMAAGRAPYDATVVARNTGYLETLAKMPWDGFNAATANEKSRALPEIFKNEAGFKAAQEKFQGEIAKLATAARTGNEAAVKAAFADVGKACSGCHDTYRANL